MNLRSRRNDELEINLTPLIDVVFLLLIFFMVSTTFERESKINLSLPEASKEAPETEQERIDVAIDVDHRFYVNGKPLIDTKPDTIERALHDAAKDMKGPTIVISADENTSHQSVIDVLDAARNAGYLHITFATTIRNDSSAP